MKFIRHYELEGKHAFLGASKCSWLNYTDDKLESVFRNEMAVQRGTELHELASKHIRLGIKMPKTKKTFDEFVNDAIGFKMETELPLYYSDNCFGTADAICFRNGTLRIHDLKTGKSQTHIEQLMIYAALFCLEYKTKPENIKIVLRIYQNDEILELIPLPDDISAIMDKIVYFDKIINKIKYEES